MAENWARKNTTKGIVYDNLRLIRAFEDHEGSEKGFILVHVSVLLLHPLLSLCSRRFLVV